ncbi:MAG: hypothetical protein ACRD22_05930 [Terriglobia bacterium]
MKNLLRLGDLVRRQRIGPKAPAERGPAVAREKGLAENPVPNYLIDQENRERSAVRRLVGNSSNAGRILSPLGLAPEFSWFILELQKSRLRSIGDVDILAGRLEWADPEEFDRVYAEELNGKDAWHPSNVAFLSALKVSQAGGIKWPPSLDWLVAIEAKCAYLLPQADSISPEHLKSTKSSGKNKEHLLMQVNSLVNLGFNRVALLDVIANRPVSGPSGGAWIAAASVAAKSRQAMAQILDARLPTDSPVGHYVWSVGAVEGGDESRRGSSYVEELQPPRDNPLLSTVDSVKEARRHMEKNLQNILASVPKPTNLRVIFVDCQRCRQIHLEGGACSA